MSKSILHEWDCKAPGCENKWRAHELAVPAYREFCPRHLFEDNNRRHCKDDCDGPLRTARFWRCYLCNYFNTTEEWSGLICCDCKDQKTWRYMNNGYRTICTSCDARVEADPTYGSWDDIIAKLRVARKKPQRERSPVALRPRPKPKSKPVLVGV